MNDVRQGFGGRWTGRRSPAARLRPERGAVAVEAALVIPLLMVLVFGMIETAVLLRDFVVTQSLARAGARVASAEPRLGTVAGHNGGPSFAQDAADSVERAGATLPRGALDYIWIYQVGDTSGNPASACPGTKCVEYKWNNLPAPNGRFVYQGGTWSPSSINACLGDSAAQSVGVRIQVSHAWVLSFPFRDARKVSARAVMKFEPLRPDHTYAGVASGCK